MPPKRGTGAGSNKLPKRVKVASDDDSFELVLDGEHFVDVDKLFKSSSIGSFLSINYKRSVKRFIADAKLPVVVVAKKDARKGILSPKDDYSPKTDLRVAQMTSDVRAILACATESLLPTAPPIIEDADLKFFVDGDGKTYNVEMRGKRTLQDILFKAKDVGRVFGCDNFVRTLQDVRCKYKLLTDYKLFTLPEYEASSNMQSSLEDPNFSPKRTPFLTFLGLMHALRSTRSQVADQFRSWIYEHVFAMAFGTVEDKKAMVKQLCRVDKAFIQGFMTLIPTNIACIYLVDTGQHQDSKRVFKFGRTGSIKERFYDHASAFGDKCELDTLVLVPANLLSKAETEFNGMITDELRYKSGKSKELLLLDRDGRNTIRGYMRKVANKYNGSLTENSLISDKKVKDIERKMLEDSLMYERRIAELQHMLDAANRQVMAEQLAASKQQLEHQHEMSRLQLRVKDSEYQALLSSIVKPQDAQGQP
ncbi:hypothetical protein AC1031_011199 [Aphanomyces cochlioides]|nr:hypothetical protein AC1031_011184 [Aphanomyces cochlioides]KAG9400277.1 hypothetical protein AC1031_011187 [Aphanomyces cochlioides]KAG9400286.1 hypothetical protein AC1031_011196 [Aphanomyces cochlioides]KAG9400290.1 hypothetical protein AC1031_011199 [Aphanomyces cochlioides]